MTQKYENNDSKVYEKFLIKVTQQGMVSSPRGQATYELLNQTMIFKDKEHIFLDSEIRRTSMKYKLAELVWFLSAKNDTEFIEHFARFWGTISDDGLTATSAYGSIIWTNQKYGMVQYDEVLKILKEDPDSRKALIHIKRPGNSTDLDMNCTLTIQFLIREGELHMSVNMRGNDMWLGTPYNYMMFKSLMILLANDLDVKVGTYFHNAMSLHIYHRDIKKMNDSLKLGKLTGKNEIYNVDVIQLKKWSNLIYNIVKSSITIPETNIGNIIKGLMEQNCPSEILAIISYLTQPTDRSLREVIEEFEDNYNHIFYRRELERTNS